MLRSLHATILDPHAKSVERLEAQKMLAKMLGATVGPDDAAPISRAADGQRAAQHRPRGMCAECCATTRAVVARLRQLEAALDDLERRDNAPVW